MPCPVYGMITMIGYKSGRIITHDVGTKRGRVISYDNERFMKSTNQEGADVLVIKLRKK